LFSSKIYSHPDKLLLDHLQNVSDSCLKKFKETKHNLSSYFPNDYWEKLVYLMGFSHDFGKATSYFQKYLFEKDEDKRVIMKNQPETSHSLISAVFTFWIAKEYVKDKIGEFLQMMPFFLYLIVKKHHGNINNPIPFSDESNELDIPIEHLDKQFEAIDKNELQFLFDKINERLSVNIQVENIPKSLKEYFKKELRRKEKRVFKRFNKKIEYYLIFQFLYSLLLHSDKEDAIFGRVDQDCHIKLENDLIEKYKTLKFGKPETKIDEIRESIFQDANANILQIDLKNKIFSLNVPTGSGKTLTCLSTAIKLKSRLEKTGIKQRIVYGLPFTSIIDQNYNVFDEILKNPESDILLKHHHLAEISYNQKDNEAEFEPEQAKFMIESWESEIIVTTFFQIFHTLFSNRNRMIQKFHKLANSIILLDEVQTIPYKYWKLVRETLFKFSDIFNVYFILITATQPRIFESSEIIELVPNKSEYFSQFDRVNLNFESESIELQNFIEKCKNEINNSDESFLFVMNTINSSIDLFENLKKMDLDAEYFYLATNIIPKHRLVRINKIKKSKKRKIIVSTQMIEAGVDIDIKNVWRDFAPLESINQVCGRCNRNFSEKKGNVRIFEILNGNHNNTPFSKYIYGKSALSIIETKESLGNKTRISETEFLKNMDSYYQIIKDKVAEDESDKILVFLENLQFADLYKSFKLIDNELYKRKDVFVEFGETAKETWQKFINLKQIKDTFKRKTEFLKFKKDFYDYVISVPEKYVPEKEYENTGIVYIPNDAVESCYDVHTGWKRTDDNYIF
jgi:CRISPR-associated endonuclease/helicase Cas3